MFPLDSDIKLKVVCPRLTICHIAFVSQVENLMFRFQDYLIRFYFLVSVWFQGVKSRHHSSPQPVHGRVCVCVSGKLVLFSRSPMLFKFYFRLCLR